MKIPITDLELYMRCPRAYKLHKLDGVEPQCKPLSLCKAINVRNVVSALHQRHPMPQSEEIAKLCGETWQEEIADSKDDQ